jgi:uncharacterized Rmd1/YagE family protein
MFRTTSTLRKFVPRLEQITINRFYSATVSSHSPIAPRVAVNPAVAEGSSLEIGNTGVLVPVVAYYAARSIDITNFTKIFGSAPQQFTRKSVTVTLKPDENRYISIFKYGSVVLFNVPKEDHVQYLRQIQAVAVSPIAEGLQKTDSYRVRIHENLEKPSVIRAEHVNIRSLDNKNLDIVSTVMAQTVALDYYMLEVESLLESFMKMNLKIQETGNFKDLSPKELYRLIASNNTVITNVLSKVGAAIIAMHSV